MRTGVVAAATVVFLAGAIVTATACRKASPRHDLIAAASLLESRPFEGRFGEERVYRPFRRAKRPELRAFAILSEELQRGSEGASLVAAIQQSTDAELLSEFSAAALERSEDKRNLLLAYEATDRAWRIARTQSAAWNRALAADRIGMSAFAASAWADVLTREPSSEWAREAETQQRATLARAKAPPAASLELFFYRRLVSQVIAGEPLADVVPGDHLVSDMAASLRRLRDSDGKRVIAALTTYMRGRDSFERNEYEDARRAYSAAEAELAALDVPLVLIARDQRIRSECSQGKPGCVDAMHAFRQEVTATGRYPWLAARSAYGEGQVLYRHGRIYEAAEHLQRALTELETLGDATSAGYMHILLANVYAAGGESDLALRHFLEGIACRTPEIRDRRRKILEDAIMFLLRHGYVATAELLLHELSTSSTTDASNVLEATLRGVIAFRRGDRNAASQHFARGRALLRTVKDDASRNDVQFRLAIAEAGSRMVAANPIIGDLDASIAAHEKTEYSVWLPQLLTERGAAYESRNDLVHAESDYRRAIGILESREPRIDETVLSLGIAAAGESPFDRAIRLLLRQGRIAGALSIAQRSNALRISSLHARGAGVRDAFRQPRGGGDGVAELQSVLQPGQIAIAHHLLRDELVTWIVSSTTIRAIRRPVSKKKLVAVEQLSDALLRPWIDGVPRGATLLIQPPAELESVAFSMLTTRDGERLVFRNPIATAPSFRAFARAVRVDAMRAGAMSAFFAAAPRPGEKLDPLPLAVSEVKHASRSYSLAQAEPHATRAAFLARSPSFAVVHFAGHVVVNATQPLSSALVFENGELLYVHELDERSFAKARLVVLSGCETGRSPRPTMSVANALLSQSVPSVVYTHWPVADDVAEEFAIAFHRAIASGKTRAEAVRNAQSLLMKKHPEDPEAWAAFALAGAPGPLAEKGDDTWKKPPEPARVTPAVSAD